MKTLRILLWFVFILLPAAALTQHVMTAGGFGGDTLSLSISDGKFWVFSASDKHDVNNVTLVLTADKTKPIRVAYQNAKAVAKKLPKESSHTCGSAGGIKFTAARVGDGHYVVLGFKEGVNRVDFTVALDDRAEFEQLLDQTNQ